MYVLHPDRTRTRTEWKRPLEKSEKRELKQTKKNNVSGITCIPPPPNPTEFNRGPPHPNWSPTTPTSHPHLSCRKRLAVYMDTALAFLGSRVIDVNIRDPRHSNR